MRLTLREVSYAYAKGRPALDRVSLAVEPGQFLAIAGRSGSGKSTLVQLMKGLLSPTAGTLLLDGRAPTPEAFDAVGLVFQYPEHQLFAPTVADDIAFGPRQQGLSPCEVDARVRQAMAGVGLDWERYHDRSPFELSGGEKRRVAIAGTLALEPTTLIADEPTAGLDLRGRRALFALLEQLRRERGTTVVVVTHRLEEVLPHATRLVVMEEGRLAWDGAPTEADRNLPDALAVRRAMLERGLPVADPPWDVAAVSRLLREVRRA